MRILVVDDDPNLFEIMNFVLREAGHEPCWADTGDEALRLVQESRPDLVLLGLSLPEREGSTMTTQIVARRAITVIMPAAMHDAPEKLLALRFGAGAFMLKSVRYSELLARMGAVTQCFAGSRAARRAERL